GVEGKAQISAVPAQKVQVNRDALKRRLVIRAQVIGQGQRRLVGDGQAAAEEREVARRQRQHVGGRLHGAAEVVVEFKLRPHQRRQVYARRVGGPATACGGEGA